MDKAKDTHVCVSVDFKTKLLQLSKDEDRSMRAILERMFTQYTSKK